MLSSVNSGRTRPSASVGGALLRLRARLAAAPRLVSWLLTVLVAFFGGLLRFIRLGEPRAVVFDETYYVKDAWTMLLTGEPRNWPEFLTRRGLDFPVDTLFAQGDTNRWLSSTEYVVHPPVGKWCIALGLKLFGGAGNTFAWRASTAIAGTIAIIIMIRVALRLFNNMSIALSAGLLMSVDGVGITLSRTGLLDIFIMVFVLGAFATDAPRLGAGQAPGALRGRCLASGCALGPGHIPSCTPGAAQGSRRRFECCRRRRQRYDRYRRRRSIVIGQHGRTQPKHAA